MEEALRAILLATSGITSLVGQRIHWMTRPQGSALPGVVLNRIDGIPDYAMSGPTGLTQSRVQLDCYGETYEAAKDVARAVTAAMSGFSGTQGGIEFQGAFVDGERDFADTGSNQPQRIPRVSVDLIIWHS